MLSRKRIYESQGGHKAWLYSVVFASKLSVVTVCFLLASLLVQPIHQALANESDATEEAPTTLPAEVEEQLPDKEPEVAAEEIQIESENETEYELDTAEEAEASPEVEEMPATGSPDLNENQEVKASSTESTESVEQIEDVATSTEQTTDKASTTQTQANTASTTDAGVVSGTQASSTETTASSTPTTGGGNEVTDEVQNQESNTTEEQESTEPVEESNQNEEQSDTDLINQNDVENDVNDLVNEVVNDVVSLTRQLVTEENYYQFSRQSCVAVGDGTYHCSVKKDIAADADSVVFAEQDADGDLEIYMRTAKGEVKQLTDNQYDDSAPHLDLANMRVVWHRLVKDRYQIITYDLEEREETQLTFSKNNNMEPKAAKEGIVWQAWDGNDWEVMFFDGEFTEQITDNSVQDVTPVIEDGYVLWSVLGGEEAEARVYEIESGEVLTITGHEGGAITNPRFVLVYDTRFENGDVLTQRFDPTTGLSAPVASQPAPLPIDIPEPDPIGEIRALIQNKSSHDESDVVTVPQNDTTDTDLNLASTTATSSDELVLNSVQFDDPIVATTSEPVVEFELTEYDLVITPTATSSTSQRPDVHTISVSDAIGTTSSSIE